MGADPQRAEEGPPRRVRVAAFRIDRSEVTNAEFAQFVAATHYVTESERAPDARYYPGVARRDLVPASLVFVGALPGTPIDDPGRWWKVVPGADWRHPTGPGSSIAGKAQLPVVHVSHADAQAYAHWRGRDLPTEAEWEYAARGGIDGARYAWGNADPLRDNAPGDRPRANIWQGPFPSFDAGDDGFKAQAAPVGCFPPNGYGLYDMAGNVWEWTSGQYPPEPSGIAGLPPQQRHVIKGGSFLCSENFCWRYRPSARQPGPADSGGIHIGFRTVLRAGRMAAPAAGDGSH